MKKFMVFIYPQGESIFNLSEQAQQQHIQKVGAYLGTLQETGALLDAQPLVPTGCVLSGSKESFSIETMKETKISGFYTLQAEDQDRVTEILKKDPRFEDASWQMEIREVLEMM